MITFAGRSKKTYTQIITRCRDIPAPAITLGEQDPSDVRDSDVDLNLIISLKFSNNTIGDDGTDGPECVFRVLGCPGAS